MTISATVHWHKDNCFLSCFFSTTTALGLLCKRSQSKKHVAVQSGQHLWSLIFSESEFMARSLKTYFAMSGEVTSLWERSGRTEICGGQTLLYMSSDTSEEVFMSCFDNWVGGTGELLRSAISNPCTRRDLQQLTQGWGKEWTLSWR